jgi:hypothetical protein
MTYKKLIADATYDSYVYNRENAPDITPEQWERIFPDWQEYEKQYQSELNNKRRI